MSNTPTPVRTFLTIGFLCAVGASGSALAQGRADAAPSPGLPTPHEVHPEHAASTQHP